MSTRQCGDCQLCCKLVPVFDNEGAGGRKPIDKPAGVRCVHQRHHKGCAIYGNHPFCCQMYSCMWLVAPDATMLTRPDRSHCVIDPTLDYFTIRNDDTGATQKFPAMQIWVDPDFPEAHREPAIREYMELQGKKGVASLVRWDNKRGMVVFSPSISEDGKWHEIKSNLNPEEQHSALQVAEALAESGIGITYGLIDR